MKSLHKNDVMRSQRISLFDQESDTALRPHPRCTVRLENHCTSTLKLSPLLHHQQNDFEHIPSKQHPYELVNQLQKNRLVAQSWILTVRIRYS
jgi:hypothetical protein